MFSNAKRMMLVAASSMAAIVAGSGRTFRDFSVPEAFAFDRPRFATRTAEPKVTTLHRAHGNRECDRRRRQNAHLRQLMSHQGPFTVKPRHIFASETT